jgi:hypothetical protein
MPTQYLFSCMQAYEPLAGIVSGITYMHCGSWIWCYTCTFIITRCAVCALRVFVTRELPPCAPFFASACAVCAPRVSVKWNLPPCALLLLVLARCCSCSFSRVVCFQKPSMFQWLQFRVFQHHAGWAKLREISNILLILYTLFWKGIHIEMQCRSDTEEVGRSLAVAH